MGCVCEQPSVTSGAEQRQADFRWNSEGFFGGGMMAEICDVTPPGATGGLNPSALSLANAAALLTKAGGARVTEEMLREDLAEGAPANADGTINLVHYAA